MQALLRLFGRLLRGKAGRIIRGIIAEGQSDPETIKAFLVGFVTPRRAEVRAILARGVASGELRADLDVEMVLASLFGSLQMRMLMNENVDDTWVDRLSKFVLGRMHGRPRRFITLGRSEERGHCVREPWRDLASGLGRGGGITADPDSRSLGTTRPAGRTLLKNAVPDRHRGIGAMMVRRRYLEVNADIDRARPSDDGLT